MAMDGRWFTVIFLEILPLVLIGVTIEFFSLNPLSIFILLALMIVGGFYLLSYTSSFGSVETVR
jgi:hypothetical protein